MKIALIAALAAATGISAAQDSASSVVDEGKLGRTHMLAPDAVLAAPGYPAAYAESGDDVCIALGYTVKGNGTTGDFRLLKAWTSNRALAEMQDRYLETYAAAAADAVSRWRFVAKDAAAAQPVMTVATLTFHGRSGTAALGERCRIGDLAAFYARLENGRTAVRRISDDRRDAAAMGNIRRAEAIARRSLGQANP